MTQSPGTKTKRQGGGLLFLVVVSLFFFSLPGHASAATYYVDTATGNNANAGNDWAHAFAQMVKAEAIAADGDTIRVKTGTYVEPSTAGGATGNIAFIKSLTWISDDGIGGAGSVIVRRASGNTAAQFNGAKATSWNGFTFDGEGTANYVMLGQSTPQSNKTWTNVTFENAANTGPLLYFYGTTAGTNNICVNCIFSGSGAFGVITDSTPLTLNNPTFNMTYSSGILISASGSASPLSVVVSGGTATLSGAMKLTSSGTGMNNSLSIDAFTINSTSTASPLIVLGTGAVSITGSTINLQSALINSGDNREAGTVTVTGNTITYSGANSTTVVRRIFSSYAVSGNVNVNNNTFNINSNTSLVYGAISFISLNAQVNITNNTINTGSSATNTGTFILLKDVTTPNITSNTMNNLYSLATTMINVATAGAVFTGTAYIGYNTITSNTSSGYMIGLGNEAPGASNIYVDRYNSSTIEHNTIYGPIYNGQATGGTTHALFVGHQRFVNVRFNYVRGAGYGTVIKGSPEDWQHLGGVYQNIYIDNDYLGILFKGAQNVDCYNNIITESQGRNLQNVDSSAIYLRNNAAGQDSTGIHVLNNLIVVNASNSMFYTDVGAIGLILNNNLYWNYDDNSTTQKSYYGGSLITGMATWASDTGDSSNFSDPKLVNFPTNLNLLSISPALDSGTSVSFTSDYASNPIYGTPDIGAYEYQPPYTFATNNIPTTGSTRLYSNGKYRMTTASSTSATGTFSVTPAGGFYTASTSAYMDITVSNWTTANKEWIATSTTGQFNTHATSTVYTIGDLIPSTAYTFNVDGAASTTAVTDNSQCVSGVCTANGSGVVSFTYVGGYSTHTFDLTEVAADTTVTPTTSGSSINACGYGFVWNPSKITCDKTATIAPTALATTPSELSSVQVQAILSLLVSFGLDQSTIDKVTTSLRGTSSATFSSPSSTPSFTRNLSLHQTGADVKALQQFLNTHGFIVASSGPGSLGNEITLFGMKTYFALVAFQKSQGLPQTGWFGPMTRAKASSL